MTPRSAGPAPDFRHVRDWIFDLDNTLYRADNGIFAQIDARMTDFVAGFCQAGPRRGAGACRRSSIADHGTTLNGLIARAWHRSRSPIWHYVHDIDLSRSAPRSGAGCGASRGCRAGALSSPMAAATMPRAFWTGWAWRHLFDADLGHPHHRLCAQARAARLCQRGGAGGPGARPQAAMFDDIARNLVPAACHGHDHGMAEDRRALGAGRARNFRLRPAAHIDHETDDLTQFLNSIRI